MRTRDVVAAGALGLLLLAGGARVVDLDVWHLMALFRAALREGWLPRVDGFAYTPTVTPMVQHEWGTGAILYAVGQLGGLAGLQVLRLVLTTVAAVAVVDTARRRGATAGTFVLLAPLGIVMAWIGLTAVRPQLFTLAFIALLVRALDRDRQGTLVSPWLWTALFVVWLNLHAGFVVGVAFIAAHAAEQRLRGAPVRHLVGLLAGVAVASLVNPYGIAYHRYLAHALTMSRPYIMEWRPLWEANPVAVAVVAVALTVAAYAAWRRGAAELHGWPLLLLATYAAVRHERHVSILALVWLAYVPAAVSLTPVGQIMTRIYDRRGWVVATGLVLAAASVAGAGRPWRLGVPGSPGLGGAVNPVGPVDYLREVGFRGNVLTPFAAGAYVLWKLTPAVRVSLDSRFEVAYPPATLADHLDFFHGATRWRTVRDGYPATDLILVERGWAVAGLLADEGRWPLVYEDDAWLVFARPGLALPARDRRGEGIEGTFP